MLDAIDVPHYWDPRPVHEDGTREKLQELGDQSAHNKQVEVRDRGLCQRDRRRLRGDPLDLGQCGE